MPTDSSAGDRDDPPVGVEEDDLTFAAHDFRRGHVPAPAPRDVGFAPVRPAEQVSAPEEDGFVIRPADGLAPAAPVDALVVGAPEPAADTVMPAAASPSAFRISSITGTAAVQPTADELWTTRDPAPQPAPTQTARRGWSTRHTERVDRSAHATMLHLREEAVNVSWKAAWIAVTSANPRLLRRRGSSSP
jgi:hypothetical protein